MLFHISTWLSHLCLHIFEWKQAPPPPSYGTLPSAHGPSILFNSIKNHVVHWYSQAWVQWTLVLDPVCWLCHRLHSGPNNTVFTHGCDIIHAHLHNLAMIQWDHLNSLIAIMLKAHRWLGNYGLWKHGLAGDCIRLGIVPEQRQYVGSALYRPRFLFKLFSVGRIFYRISDN